MRAIRIPKADKWIFLEAARLIGLEFTELKKLTQKEHCFFHCDKYGLSQNDIFRTGVKYHELKAGALLPT